MDYNNKIIQFCEKKLFPNQPEYLNSFSALFICYISFKDLKQIEVSKNPIFSLIHILIFINGISAFLYHWNNIYLFKLLDGYSMIIPLWLGIYNTLIKLNYNLFYLISFSFFNHIFLILLTFPWFDNYFALVFALEIITLIPLYRETRKINNNIQNKNGIKGILICLSSGFIWGITELKCNKYLILGHSVWHIGMSTGLSYLIQYLDVIEYPKIKCN